MNWTAKRWQLLLPLAVFGSLAWVLDTRAQERTELENILRAGHRAARESIRTLSAVVTVKELYPLEVTRGSGHYWRARGIVRVQENRGAGTEDYVVKNSEIRQVARGLREPGGRPEYHAARRPATERFCLCDAWTLLEIDLSGPGGRPCTLDEFLDLAQGGPKVTRVKLDGRDCIKAVVRLRDVSGQNVTATTWHDISHNYLLWRSECRFESDGDYRIEGEITDFLEAEPGIFFPTTHRTMVMNLGKKVQETVAMLSDIRINGPVAERELQLPSVPAQTQLDDRVQGKQYRIDPNWHPTGGPSAPLVKIAMPGHSDAEGETEYRSPSTEEPRSALRWLMPGSLAVLGCAGVSWIYHRRHAAKPSAS
jgi:hypothetical protein